jgi:outer membrane protein OmpA-like peptidoglycan-associated protein
VVPRPAQRHCPHETCRGPGPPEGLPRQAENDPGHLPIAPRGHRGPGVLGKGHHLSKGQAATLTGDGLFAFNSAVITKTGPRQLRTLAASLKGTDKAITCEGYTDYAGNAAHEKTLSRARATAACSALTSFGVKALKHSIGYGRARPVTIGGTPHARTANRRVVIYVTR